LKLFEDFGVCFCCYKWWGVVVIICNVYVCVREVCQEDTEEYACEVHSKVFRCRGGEKVMRFIR